MAAVRHPGAHPAVAVVLAIVAVMGAVVVTWVIAREILPGLGQRPATRCSVVFPPDRCSAIRAEVATELGVPSDAVSTIEIVSVRDAGVTDLSAPGFLARARVGERISDVPMCRGLRVAATPACELDDQYP
jgi:hypothetical protein